MFSLMLRKNFIAQHFLIGKDFGNENIKHSHHYKFEIEIESPTLDEFNFIVDIVEVRNHVENVAEYFNDKTLNDIPEFKDKNPSLELFSKIIWQKFNNHFNWQTETLITVRVWEDEIAQASYRELKKCALR